MCRPTVGTHRPGTTNSRCTGDGRTGSPPPTGSAGTPATLANARRNAAISFGADRTRSCGDRPAAPDHHAVLRHCLGERAAIALHIHHEAVRFRRDAAETTLAQPRDGGLPHLGIRRGAINWGSCRLASARQCWHGQWVVAQAGQFAQAVGMRATPRRRPAMPYSLRTQHDQVIALRYLRDQARLLAVLQVGLVDQHAGRCGLGPAARRAHRQG